MPLFSRWEADEVMLHPGKHSNPPKDAPAPHFLPSPPWLHCMPLSYRGGHPLGWRKADSSAAFLCNHISSSKHHLLQVLLDSVSFQLPVSFISPSGFRVASPGLARSFCELFPFYCSSFLSNELCRSLQAHLRLRTFLFSGLILCL